MRRFDSDPRLQASQCFCRIHWVSLDYRTLIRCNLALVCCQRRTKTGQTFSLLGSLLRDHGLLVFHHCRLAVFCGGVNVLHHRSQADVSKNLREPASQPACAALVAQGEACRPVTPKEKLEFRCWREAHQAKKRPRLQRKGFSRVLRSK